MQWFDPDHDYVNEYIDTWNQKIRSAKAWMIALGAVLVLTGIASAVAPLGMYALIQGLIAGVLIVRGGSNIASYIQTPAFIRNGATLAAGILNALLGVLFFALPASFTASTLGFLLAFLLIMTGIERLSFAQSMRYYQLEGSSAGTVMGIVNIILGVVLALTPLFTSVVLSYLLAAYLIVAGATLIVEGASIKRIER
ncbi:HdeD family acid-resistance protein [Enorma massiliensis]|uniref:HdeD family acid-resistance protein n=1 Tax=Enorma massiliensis TaxID=1472761 RepID=UPI003AB3142B